MFDFDAGKLLIVGIVALIFIPPKDLPRVLRQTGQFVAKMRRMARDFQGQFMDAMREADMADLRREAQKLADSAKVDVGFNPVHDLRRDLEAKPTALPAPSAESPVSDGAGADILAASQSNNGHIAERTADDNHAADSHIAENHGEAQPAPAPAHPV